MPSHQNLALSSSSSLQMVTLVVARLSGRSRDLADPAGHWHRTCTRLDKLAFGEGENCVADRQWIAQPKPPDQLKGERSVVVEPSLTLSSASPPVMRVGSLLRPGKRWYKQFSAIVAVDYVDS
jgi:hypothetical protein